MKKQKETLTCGSRLNGAADRAAKYRVGTSGYSFDDWVGPFYPPGTRSGDMLACYAHEFNVTEINFTYYRMPSARTMEGMARKTPPDFTFWLKANQQITHERSRRPVREFLDNLRPLVEWNKLDGVLLQFPQSFHRTVANRRFLAGVLSDFQPTPLAVEFRHRTWQHPDVLAGLRDRDVALVIPDCPAIEDLFHWHADATNRTAYLRLHSRNADLWYAGPVERYDYCYSEAELRELLEQWSEIEQKVDRVYAFFNNCHRAQAAQNAEAFRRLLDSPS